MLFCGTQVEGLDFKVQHGADRLQQGDHPGEVSSAEHTAWFGAKR